VADDAGEPCELLAWDTRFFGFRVARVRGDALTERLANAIESWCKANAVPCLYFLARSGDAETVTVAEAHGYHLADVRVTLSRESGGGSQTSDLKWEIPSGIRAARPDDVPRLRAIARVSHTDTRFFFDQRFGRERAESLYETWIESSVSGFAQAVLIAEHEDEITGYVTCHVASGQRTGSIGLIAVAPGHQGRGVGKALVGAATGWLSAHGVTSISVVTQGRNLAAQRLYARCGFIPRSVELYYHRWFSDAVIAREPDR
jgi:GNAT superfamily N-acetyltransferase